MSLRKAVHAGSWYNSDGTRLNHELEDWLAKAEVSHSPARAIIAPHAGYSYCGGCGGFAYKQIDPSKVNRVFILGPSHHVYLPNCVLPTTSYYQTPLYNLKIDQDVCFQLNKTGKFGVMNESTDEQEHSIEMHLPYVAKVMESKKDNFTIVPVLVGAIKTYQEQEYGKIFSPYLADPQNLFVISSDFCHWGKRFRYTPHDKSNGHIHSSIEAMDRAGMDIISSLDTKGFTEYLDKTQNTICGRHPIAVLLNAVDHLRASCPELSCALKFVQYAQSSKCKSMSDSSVSYASASLLIQSPPSKA